MAKRNIFNSISLPKVGSSNFDLSHDVKLSTQFGRLTPIMCQEVIPGDKWNISCMSKIRFAPLIAPIMHRVNVFMHYFYVPNRLLWSHWDDWIWNPEAAYVPPFVRINDGGIAFSPVEVGAISPLFDYMGLPQFMSCDASGNIDVSALPFAAYQCVFNEYYRDQNLQSEVDYALNDGEVPSGQLLDMVSIRNRAWQKDLFTSALPWPQRGSEVLMPFEGQVTMAPEMQSQIIEEGGSPITNATTFATNSQGQLLVDGQTGVMRPNGYEVENGSTSIRDLRRALKLQEWFERSARGGARPIEALLNFFGVKAQDDRLQRPEYLGGTMNPVAISEVLQTSESSATPQGNMSGHGISVGMNKGISKYCPEHGYIIGIMSVMPKPAYQQGVPKHFKKFDQFDYAWPQLQHIGEQEVRLDEIYAGALTGGVDGSKVFGYAPRYYDYKYQPSSVHGDFRTTLNHWHMGRIFSSEPALNEDFIEMKDSEVSRVFAVEEGDKLWCQIVHGVNVRRKLAFYSNPML